MYTDERVVRFINENFIPAKLHVRDQAADYQRFAERFDAQWTPTILELDPDANVRHKIEGFLPADDFLAQLMLGQGHTAFKAGDFKAAESHFRRVVKELPNTEAAPEALYWAGVSSYKEWIGKPVASSRADGTTASRMPRMPCSGLKSDTRVTPGAARSTSIVLTPSRERPVWLVTRPTRLPRTSAN